MQTRQNVEKMAKCGDFLSGARGNAKLMINFFLISPVITMQIRTYRDDSNKRPLEYKHSP